MGAFSAIAGNANAARPTAGSVTAERLKLPSGPSSVRGLADEPSVDPIYGQIGYQVPIELPAALGNLTPSLALSYSGTLGNGALGIGWTLAEPKIVRSTKHGVPKFDDTDTFEISGVASGRLVSIGADEYRVEGMGQTVRIKRVGAGFEVDDGRGNHYTFGASAASRQDRDATSTLEWRLEQQTNLMGERVRYTYTHDGGQIYLAHIVWGPGDVYSVAMGYQARPDTTTSYRSGFRVDTAQRLASIRVDAAGHERRIYQLSYSDPAAFSVSRLASVSSTGVDHAGAWPTLTFTYAAPTGGTIEPVAGVGSWRLNTSGTTLVDLDGDGAADLLQLTTGGHSYMTNQRGVFGGLQTLTGNTQGISAVQLHDIDGDGRADLLQDTGSGWVAYRFAKTQWVPMTPTGVWPGTVGLALKQPLNTRFADLNGDGLVDAIQWDNDALKIHRATRTGLLPAYNVGRIGGTVLPTATGRFQDVNGDGLDDYIVTASDRLDVYIGHGDGTFEPRKMVAYPFSGSISSPEDIELADLDRDGLIDLMRIELGTVKWFQGRPDGAFATTPTTLANPELLSSAVVVAVADTNGNGSQDVVWSSSSGVWRMDLAGPTTAGMLTRVDNGLGMTTDFTYDASQWLAASDSQAGAPWTTNIPMSIPVPTKKVSNLGPGEVAREVNYRVRNGVWDADEQTFAGFTNTTVTTAGATAAETSTINTSYSAGVGANRELRGLPQIVEVKDGTGKRISITANTWALAPVAGLPNTPLLLAPELKTALTQYADTVPARIAEIDYAYDALGRRTTEKNLGRTDLTGDESIKTTTYADDDTTWIRNRVCEEKITDLAGAVASDVQNLFGDESTVLPLCSVGKGWPRESRAWLDRESRFVTQEAATYDVHGNLTTMTKGGVTRHITFDANGLFPIQERVTGDHDLVWSATWDPVLGAMTSSTDPNGHVTHALYDSLGRFAGSSIDDHAPHQLVEYDWTAPSPKTTTWTYDGPLADVGAKPAAWTSDSHWRQSVEVTNGKGETRYHALRLADAQWIISDYRERDPNSRVVFAGRPVYTTSLDLASRPLGMSGDTLRYDPLGRLIEQRLPTGQARAYTYTSFERTVQDANLAVVHSSLDGAGRPTLTERTAGAQHETVRASYDPMGRLTRMTLADGAVVRDFAYDSLGRLRESHDPDLGARTLTWDDSNRLLSELNAAGQTTTYTYDALGRLASRDAGTLSRFHYDDAREGTFASNLSGRLAWIEEPTGVLDTSYDELGRQILRRHQIDDKVSTSTSTFSASGQLLGHAYDDGFELSYRYDAAGRLVEIPNYWQVLEQDASGQPLHELAGNGVDTRYERDVLNQTVRISMRDPSAHLFYDVAATRDVANNLTGLTDTDGTGLDHTATFSYDPFSRLISTTIGQGADQFAFTYQYDVLHNMTARTQSGPRALNVFTGAYRYGEGAHAPRQLTSIVDASNVVTHTFDYDAAGRQIAEDGRTLTYDASDRLIGVSGLAGGSEQHVYDSNGDRVKTVEPDGSVSYFFGDGTADRNGGREHDVVVGARTVARVVITPGSGSGAGTAFPLGTLVVGGLGTAALAALALSLRRRREASLRWAVASLATLTAGACSSTTTAAKHQALDNAVTTYTHNGYGAGPLLTTNAAGSVAEERRYEAFGAVIDAAATSTLDLSELGKRVDRASGWSDHGARWLQPEVARWTSTDPPVAAPDAKFMGAPWALHPYQYVNANPVAFWDPDGRAPDKIVPDSPIQDMSVPLDPLAGAEASASASPQEHEEDPTDEMVDWGFGFWTEQDKYLGVGMEWGTRPLNWDWDKAAVVPYSGTVGKYSYLIASPVIVLGTGTASLLWHDFVLTPYHVGHGLYRSYTGPDYHSELQTVEFQTNSLDEPPTSHLDFAYVKSAYPMEPTSVEYPNSEPVYGSEDVYWNGDVPHGADEERN